MVIHELKYSNTNTYLIEGDKGKVLFDTGWAGTMPAFCRCMGDLHVSAQDIDFLLISHFHPDHMGIIGSLVQQGAKLLLLDVQKDQIHYSDYIFKRDHLPFVPLEESQAVVISCKESREFLGKLGIQGEIIHTPSHSPDSISLILDNGDCLVGDLEPYEYIEGYEDNTRLKEDWEKILSHHPKRIFYAHAPERVIG